MVSKKKGYEFWLDTWARKIVERERKLKRRLKVLRTESGLGASGIPHIGSLGDVIRQYGVTLALRDMGLKSELIAYSDDRDGLRKVPLGLPNWLEKYIGKPVSNIPDPFGCCESYGRHMSGLLLDGIEKVGIDCKFQSGSEAYKGGFLDKEIEKILLNAKKAGKIIHKMTGQDKFLNILPYFALCENCGKIYTTRCYDIVPEEHKVLYICDQEFVGSNKNTGKRIIVKGCGHKGEAFYFKGDGKLAWKVEFAARWSGFELVFEAIGKDILDSVKVNDRICREIIGWEPPLHFIYEMFLEKGGKKISKSVGNVFTPQTWLTYGSPESLFLLMLKRSGTIRTLDVTDIPSYMLEVDKLEDIYFGIKKIENSRDEFNAKRLFEFIYKLKPPKHYGVHISYDYLVELASVAPEKKKLDFVLKSLKQTGHIKEVNENTRVEIGKRFNYAENWFNDFEKPEEKFIELSSNEKNAIKELIDVIKIEVDGEKIQTQIFKIAKKHNIKPVKFFTLIYQIILNQERGPRLGPYIIQRGKNEIIKNLNESLKSERKIETYRSGIIDIDPKVKERFSEMFIGSAIIKNIEVKPSGDEFNQYSQKVIEKWGNKTLIDELPIKANRDFFRKSGIDPTKLRPSGEANIRGCIKGNLPKINNVVDAGNFGAAISGLSTSVYDLDKIKGRLKVRFARHGEEYYGFGLEKPMILEGKEVIIADDEKIIALYPYRDAKWAPVTKETKNVLIQSHSVPGVNKEYVAESLKTILKYLGREAEIYIDS